MDLSPILAAFDDDGTPVIRTDFSDDAAWELVAAELLKGAAYTQDDEPDDDLGEPLDLGDDLGFALTAELEVDESEHFDWREGEAENLIPVSDRAFAGLTPEALGEACIATRLDHFGCAVLVDERTIAEASLGPALTAVYIDLSVSDPEAAELYESFMGRSFRFTASEILDIEVNLSLGNLDFGDFADAVGPDGVYRGTSDEEALAIIEDDSTEWTPVHEAGEAESIRKYAELRDTAAARLDQAVIRARRNGLTWVEIGDALGVSRRAARREYAGRV